MQRVGSEAEEFHRAEIWRRANLFKHNLMERIAAGDMKGLELLPRHDDWRIRLMGIHAVEALWDARTIAPLIRCLTDSDERVRVESSQVLEDMAAHLARVFRP